MKKTISLMMVLLVAITLTGCGSKETNDNLNNNGENINANDNTQKDDSKSKNPSDENSVAFLNKIYNGEYYDGNSTTDVSFKVTKFDKEKGITEISVNGTTYKLTNNEIIEADYGTVYYAEYEDLSLNMNYKTDDSFSIKASISQNSKISANDRNKDILKLTGSFK